MLHAGKMPISLQGGKRTGVGDVETPTRHGVVGLKFQPENVAVAREMGRHLRPCEAAEDVGVQRLAILHGQDVVRSFQVEIVEGQVDAAAGLRQDQPYAVKVVPVAFWVIRREDCTHGGGEV